MEALKAVNKELIFLYWDIGRMIVEKQRGEIHGENLWWKCLLKICKMNFQVYAAFLLITFGG